MDTTKLETGSKYSNADDTFRTLVDYVLAELKEDRNFTKRIYRYLINDDSIAKMKDGVMIINTGRGLLIHTNALIEGLKTKKVSAAGLDVYEEEGDYFYEDKSDKIIDDDVLARLLSFNNVIVTSHQAFFTKEALHNIAETTLRNIKDFEEGRPLVNEVTK